MSSKFSKTLIASSTLLLAQSGMAGLVVTEADTAPFSNSYGTITPLLPGTSSVFGTVGGNCGETCTTPEFDFLRLAGYAPGEAFNLTLDFSAMATGTGGSGGATPFGSAAGSASGSSGSGSTPSATAQGELHFLQASVYLLFAGDSGGIACPAGSGSAVGSSSGSPTGSGSADCVPAVPGESFGLTSRRFVVAGLASDQGLIEVQIGGQPAAYELQVSAPASSSNAPEPGSLALMATAMAGLGFARRRRRGG